MGAYEVFRFEIGGKDAGTVDRRGSRDLSRLFCIFGALIEEMIIGVTKADQATNSGEVLKKAIDGDCTSLNCN